MPLGPTCETASVMPILSPQLRGAVLFRTSELPELCRVRKKPEFPSEDTDDQGGVMTALSRPIQEMQGPPGGTWGGLPDAEPRGRGAERGGGAPGPKWQEPASTSPVTWPRVPLHAIWPCSASASHPQGSHSPPCVSLLPERSPSCWLI